MTRSRSLRLKRGMDGVVVAVMVVVMVAVMVAVMVVVVVGMDRVVELK